MTKFPRREIFKIPKLVNLLMAILSAVLLISAFPGFELFYFAWLAFVPLFFAVKNEKDSWFASFVLGWTFGTLFFFGSCWWLTFAPTTYANFPALLSYFLLFCVCLVAGLFPAIAAVPVSVLLKRFGAKAIFFAPFLWTATEFLRFWLTGNNWNAVGYSQAFRAEIIQLAAVGGVSLIGFLIVSFNAALFYFLIKRSYLSALPLCLTGILLAGTIIYSRAEISAVKNHDQFKSEDTNIIAVQPNVPMSDLDDAKWQILRQKHIESAESAIVNIKRQRANVEGQKTIVIFPESPMNFMYGRDEEFQEFIKAFTVKNNVGVLFNSAESNRKGDQFYNSAVMVNEEGRKIFQYDKIHLLPFGEYLPLSELVGQIIPPMVGNYAFGENYELVPLGDAKAGVMICFESHFPDLSNKFVRNGADALVEMTNDGYLGNTPILRQHLANAVFRAVETNRPVLRVTNVGITARISERGEITDAANVYTEATRVWTVGKSDGRETVYVKFGDWFAWLCVIISCGLIIVIFKRNYKNN